MSSNLFNAIVKDKMREAFALLDNKSVCDDINQQYGDMSETCLYLACDKCYGSIVQKILQLNGIDVNKSNKFKYTPLHAATNRQNITIVKLLINKGAILKGDWGGNTPLHSAAYSGNAIVLECLLQKFKKHINDKRVGRFSSGDTPLHSAVDKGKLSTVMKLIDLGADMTIKNNSGLTAYAIAKRRNFKDIMILLKGDKGLKYERSLAGSKMSIASQGTRRKIRKTAAFPKLTKHSLEKLPKLSNSKTSLVVNNGWSDTKSVKHFEFEHHLSPRRSISPLPQINRRQPPRQTFTDSQNVYVVPNIIIHNSLSGTDDNVDEYDGIDIDTQRTHSSLSTHSSVFDNQEVLEKLTQLEGKIDRYNRVEDRVEMVESRVERMERHFGAEDTKKTRWERSTSMSPGRDRKNAEGIREVIRTNFEYLEDNIIATEHIYYLYSKKALTENDLEIIENYSGNKQMTRKLLIILLKKKNFDWVFAFKTSLEKTEESHHVLHVFSHLL